MHMAPTTHDLATGSNASPISGYPVIGEYFDEYMDEFSTHFDDAMSKALAWARKDFRNRAHNVDSWREFADILDVEFDGNDFCYVVTDPDKFDDVMDLEYGTMDAAPNSLIRKVALSQPAFLAKIITDHMEGTVPSA